jgi:predicted  nucleic acid-binding Zn-ribbon protein
MLESLKVILDIQELDIKMIRLMRLKHDRQKELTHLQSIKSDLEQSGERKKEEILELKKTIKLIELEVSEVVAKIKKLDAQQSAVKKVDEFNALTHEMSQAEREKTTRELRLSDHMDKLAAEDDALKNLQTTLESTQENSKALEVEILEGILRINEEGRVLKAERDALVEQANPDTFSIYERLLRNKKDRVVVPIENRCCSGCHIMLTAQDENLVRKGERLVFCEHCSRIHYWPESKALEGTGVAVKQRRRRTTKV